MVHHGADRARGADFKKRAAKHALVLSSYSLLHRELELLKQVSWASLVLDEAQNIKNPQTKQAQAARSIPVEHRDRPDRHTGREPRRRSVVDHRVLEPRLAGHADRIQAEVPRTDPGRQRSRGNRAGSSG